MHLLDARTGMERLTKEDCLELLAADEVGRLAVVDFGTPVIFPVNYVVDGETIVFRTDPGTKLTKARHARASFEIDHFDRQARTGWSVVAVGWLEEITSFDGAVFDRLRALPIEPWAGGEKQHWLRVVTDRISGRRIRPAS